MRTKSMVRSFQSPTTFEVSGDRIAVRTKIWPGLLVRLALGSLAALAAMAVLGVAPLQQPAFVASETRYTGSGESAESTALAEHGQTPASAEATSVAPAISLCPRGLTPLLNVGRFPTSLGGGTTTAEAAVALIAGTETPIVTTPFGARRGAPVWAVAGGKTYFVTLLADGTWFASPATLTQCIDPFVPQPIAPKVQGPVG
jgi:hypothetical protein